MFDRPESKGIARPYVIPDWLREARDTALPTDRLPALFVRMHPNMKADEEPFINHLHEHHSTMRYLMTERAENMRFTLPIKVSERTVAKAQGLPVLFVYSQIVRFGGILLGQAYFEGTGSILAVKPFAPDESHAQHLPSQHNARRRDAASLLIRPRRGRTKGREHVKQSC